MTDDPRTIEVRGLRGAGEHIGLTRERIRQLSRSDPYFPKPIRRAQRPQVSWSAAQLDAYKQLRAARQLWRENARRRIDAFRAAEAEGIAGERLSHDLVTDDGLYQIGAAWRIYFRGQAIAGGIDSKVDAQITLEHLRRQEADLDPSPREQDELAEFLAAKVPETEPFPDWMVHYEGRPVGEGLPLTGSFEELWGVAWLPQMAEIFAVRMTGPPRPKPDWDVRSAILLSDLPATIDRTTTHRLFQELCASPIAHDPCVGLSFLRKALAICFPRRGERPSKACYLDRAADVAWLAFHPSSTPIGSVDTDWGLIEFRRESADEDDSRLPRSIEVKHASRHLPAAVLGGIPSVRGASTAS